MSDLRRLVTATNQLQERLQYAVNRLEQQQPTSTATASNTPMQQQFGSASLTGPSVPSQNRAGPSTIAQQPNCLGTATASNTPMQQQFGSASLTGSGVPSQIRAGPSTIAQQPNASVFPLSSGTSQRQVNMSSLFNWNPSSSVGKKRKYQSGSRGSKKKKLPTWTHTFVCLASVCQEITPDGQERAELQIAGLGEKRITLAAYADAQAIYDELTFQFPKLVESGGFELLRVPEGGKRLDVIASPESGYTVSYLKAVIHHAKIYIRPMQKDLSLEPTNEPVYSEPPKEKCHTCGDMLSITSLREHMVVCRKRERHRKSGEDPKPLSYDDGDFMDSPRSYPVHTTKYESSQHPTKPLSYDDGDFMDNPYSYPLSPSESQNGEQTARSGQTSADAIFIDESKRADTGDDDADDPVLEVALHLSKQDEQPPPSDEPKNAADVVNSLMRNLKTEIFTFEMVVRRGHVLSDALRRMEKLAFDPSNPIKVVFVGERGSDTGGLTREFFRLIQYSIKSKYMEDTGCFRHNAVAYQDQIFLKLGTLAAMSFVNEGASFRLFSPCVYNFMCGMDAADLIAEIDEVPDSRVRKTLKQIEGTTDIDAFRAELTENMDLLMECGYTKPVSRADLGDKPDIIQSVTLHKVVLVSLAELSQFRKGLATLGVATALKDYPHLLQSFFSLRNNDQLTSDSIRKLFTEIRYSELGTNARVKEEAAFMYLIDYLDDCERVESSPLDHEEESDEESEMAPNIGAAAISLKTVLAFFTGADCIPPSGYESATLTFNPTDPYPTASTCAIQLTLPTKYDSFDEFKKHMNTAMGMHGGFGLI